jgi:CRP/FNR family transcriptional regulator, cyclic AMP receptor protein
MDILKNIEMFSNLTDEELSLIQTLCHSVSSENEEILIGENQRGENLFILVSGRVEILVKNPVHEGESICLARLKPSESFGEFSVFDNAPRSASAVSQGKSELLKINSDELNALLDKHPVLGMKLMRNLGKILCTRLRTIDIEYRNSNLWIGI